MLPPQFGEKILKIVVELSEVADVAARARCAMAADVRCNDHEVICRQAFGDFVHADRMPGGAVDHDRDLLRVAVSRGIKPIGEGRAVAGLEVG